MSCSGCFNRCLETTSDQCVKYTGLPIEFLDISTEDPLSVIEDKIITYLRTVLDGTGITPDIDLAICDILSSLLITGPFSLNDLLSALAQAVCVLNTQLTAVDAVVTGIEQEYTTGCLEDVTTESDTHDVLQAVIDQLCITVSDLENLIADVETNYEKKSDLNNDIAAYLEGSTSSRYYNRMIPYTAVEYYGSLSYFDPTGAGIVNTDWEKIYICNGQNGTPDKRGFSPVGAIVNSGNSALDPIVDGLTPIYTTGITYGDALVQLTEATLPSHTHTATATPHTHSISIHTLVQSGSDNACYTTNPAGTNATLTTDSVTESISIASKGGSESHDNIPPVLACFYIMYRP